MPEKKINLDSLLWGIPEISYAANLSKNIIWQFLSSGKFGPEPIYLCKRKLFLASDVRLWIELRCPTREQFLQYKTKQTAQKIPGETNSLPNHNLQFQSANNLSAGEK